MVAPSLSPQPHSLGSRGSRQRFSTINHSCGSRAPLCTSVCHTPKSQHTARAARTLARTSPHSRVVKRTEAIVLSRETWNESWSEPLWLLTSSCARAGPAPRSVASTALLALSRHRSAPRGPYSNELMPRLAAITTSLARTLSAPSAAAAPSRSCCCGRA